VVFERVAGVFEGRLAEGPEVARMLDEGSSVRDRPMGIERNFRSIR
jgi:hypothetical protein